MKHRITRVFVLFIVMTIGPAGIWWSTRSPKLNILLITLDTTRADHLGCYGFESANTPNLDRLAKEGAQFLNAYTAVPITLPSHATMFTGLLPPEHGVRINGTNRLADGVPTLAEILQKQGYDTGAFVSSLVLDKRFGLSRGFKRYDDYLATSPDSVEAERPAIETISAALRWFRSLPSGPFFCWVHLYDPHEPYRDHPDEFPDRFQGSPYDAELAYMDLHIGRLLDFLREKKLDERTLIVIAGDHGEGLNEHQEPTHGFQAYNSTMHVPLIVVLPRVPKRGLRVDEPVSLVDVFPTVLDILRMSTPTKTTGRTLMPALRGQPLEPRACYGETEAPSMEGPWAPLRTWTTAQWKYIDSVRSELYDLSTDPAEQHNLFDQQTEEADRLLQQLGDFQSTLQSRQGATTVMSPAEESALAGLGYVRGQAPTAKQPTELHDVKDAVQYLEQAHRCSHLVHQGQADRAKEILGNVVQVLPEYAKGWGMLGICNLVQNQFGEAEQNYRRSLELDPNQNFARIGLGRSLLAQNRLPEAIEQFKGAVAFDPAAVDGQYFLGEALLKSQQWAEARAAFEATLKLVPNLSTAQLGLADVARDSGDLQEAVKRYRALVDQERQSTTARIRLGQALIKSGDESEALAEYESLLQMNESNPELLVEMSRLLAASQNQAIRNSARAVKLAELACKLTDRRNTGALRALAAAYASQQQADLAVRVGREALSVARETSPVEEVAGIEQELAGYENLGK